MSRTRNATWQNRCCHQDTAGLQDLHCLSSSRRGSWSSLGGSAPRATPTPADQFSQGPHEVQPCNHAHPPRPRCQSNCPPSAPVWWLTQWWVLWSSQWWQRWWWWWSWAWQVWEPEWRRDRVAMVGLREMLLGETTWARKCSAPRHLRKGM